MNETSFLPSRFARHKFVTLIFGTLTISIILVSISLWLYASSGTELLDLSRPGYQDVSKSLASENSASKEFSSTGPLDHKIMTEFQSLYSDNTKKVINGAPFGGDPLSPDTLGLGPGPDVTQ